MRAEPRQDLGSASGSETPTPLVPYRYSLDWCAATEESTDEDIFDAVYEFIVERGGFVEGGMVHRMPDEDVVPGSLLADALTRSESPSGAVATPKDSGGGR